MNKIQLLFAVTVLPQLYLKINIFIEPRKQEREREREREREENKGDVHKGSRLVGTY
jgi:hypothetical protein